MYWVFQKRWTHFYGPCDFLWGYVDNSVFLPPLATDVDDLKQNHSSSDLSARDTLRAVWVKFHYPLDVVCTAACIKNFTKLIY